MNALLIECILRWHLKIFCNRSYVSLPLLNRRIHTALQTGLIKILCSKCPELLLQCCIFMFKLKIIIVYNMAYKIQHELILVFRRHVLNHTDPNGWVNSCV